eukprot:768530-Hanusia_phi.AAC.4
MARTCHFAEQGHQGWERAELSSSETVCLPSGVSMRRLWMISVFWSLPEAFSQGCPQRTSAIPMGGLEVCRGICWRLGRDQS